jgi:hypothetical protein
VAPGIPVREWAAGGATAVRCRTVGLGREIRVADRGDRNDTWYGTSEPEADADPAGQLLSELNEATLSDPGSVGVLPEPDLFGLLTPADPPEFLRGHDYSEITVGQGLDLLRRLDLKRPAPNWSAVAPHSLRDLDDFVLTRELPEHERGWAENEMPLPAELQLLRARASIWLGGPLDTSSPAKVELRKNIAESEK